MKKQSPLILFALILSLTLAACQTNTAATTYATGMKDALAKYQTWMDGTYGTYHDLMEVTTNLDSTATYGELIAATYSTYYSGTGTAPSTFWDPADLQVVSGQVEMTLNEGLTIQDAIEGLTPTEEIQAQHDAFAACLKYRTDVLGSLLSMTRDDTFVQLNYTTSPCENIDTVLADLSAFVETNAK